METSQLAELIKTRRSIRSWTDKPVSQELLSRAIELATHAPNGGNQQNWYFYVILNKEVIGQIADAVQETSNYIASWPEFAEMGDYAGRFVKGAAFFRSAPAAIAVAAKPYGYVLEKLSANRASTDPRAKLIQEGRSISNPRIQSVASATAYLLLVLHQMGLGAVWMTGPMQAKSAIEKILGVPKEMDLVAFVPVGYPAENPPIKERKPLNEICQVIKYSPEIKNASVVD